jgi:hypothetical protein
MYRLVFTRPWKYVRQLKYSCVILSGDGKTCHVDVRGGKIKTWSTFPTQTHAQGEVIVHKTMKRTPKPSLRRSKRSLTSMSPLSELAQGAPNPLSANESNLPSSPSPNQTSFSSMQPYTKRNLSTSCKSPILRRQSSSISIDSNSAVNEDPDASKRTISDNFSVLHWLVVGVVVAQFRNLLPLLVVLGSFSLQRSRQLDLSQSTSSTSFSEMSHTPSLLDLLSSERERRETLQIAEDSSSSRLTTTQSVDMNEDEWGHFTELEDFSYECEQVEMKCTTLQRRRKGTLSILRECDDEE